MGRDILKDGNRGNGNELWIMRKGKKGNICDLLLFCWFGDVNCDENSLGCNMDESGWICMFLVRNRWIRKRMNMDLFIKKFNKISGI